MSKLLLLTGASGTLGRFLARALAARGYRLRLSDIKPFPDELPNGADFIAADLADQLAVDALVHDTDAVLHFGGISTERPWQEIVGPNLLGVTHIFEAARRQGQRIVFASSNHTIGYHRRSEDLDKTVSFRPDGYYGISKIYGEMVGQMMFDKYGLESVHLRIGSALPRPVEARHLSTWLSLDDLNRLVVAAVDAPTIGHAVVWGVSANTDSWWFGDDAARIGYQPQDNAADYAPLSEPGSKLAQRWQGGTYAAEGYSRADAHSET